MLRETEIRDLFQAELTLQRQPVYSHKPFARGLGNASKHHAKASDVTTGKVPVNCFHIRALSLNCKVIN